MLQIIEAKYHSDGGHSAATLVPAWNSLHGAITVTSMSFADSTFHSQQHVSQLQPRLLYNQHFSEQRTKRSYWLPNQTFRSDVKHNVQSAKLKSSISFIAERLKSLIAIFLAIYKYNSNNFSAKSNLNTKRQVWLYIIYL